MTLPEIRNLVTMLLALLGAAGCFAYALTNQRRKAKRPVYAIAGICFLMSALIYSIGAFIHVGQSGLNAILADLYYLLRSGWLGAGVYWLLVASFLALIITDWRKNERD